MLQEADMNMYGSTPASDDLELVVCGLCLKPLLKRTFATLHLGLPSPPFPLFTVGEIFLSRSFS